MNDSPSVDKLSFRVHLIREHGRKRDLSVRVLLIENTNVQSVYEGFVSWALCMRWIDRLSAMGVSEVELAAVLKSLERKRLATISYVQASPHDLESLGIYRADG
jgi:hypothetical protein